MQEKMKKQSNKPPTTTELYDSNRVSLKDIRDTYYQLRNFEISNLWQRSIFLSALLVLFFTAYGYLTSELIKCIGNSLVLNEICCGIALCGFSFSIIWIMMAKGSKAWYEVYERRICDIEKEKELKIDEDYRMGADCRPHKLDSNLFTMKAGRYSVSKLNIMIGISLMIIWVAILVIHYTMALVEFNPTTHHSIINTIIFILIPVLFLTVFITALCNTWAESGSLEDPQKLVIANHYTARKD